MDSVFIDDKGIPVLCLLSTNNDLGGLLYSGTVYTHFKKGSMAGTKLASFEYEIFGKVQGVFFRKYTQKTAKSLGLVGWVRNTEQKTVKGVAQGKEDKLAEMKKWLQTKGSPKSRIDRAVFKNEKSVSELEFTDFVVRH